ncbi:CAAX prenyl protease-like protein [Kribbella sp. VKM Ac-2527]|uniref:CAAX prenyl protease-like protein n=1 Tax=Kribbella caucasensis TaxID=2512215 RepID=A0A4R6K6J0_9ACTN|nr:CPBP family intramembrane glutamic endopeptidase [Kribbella sp. VKM Ac-2527]TDO45109.1 CAAX prenyl protease-like protein [Kribbella sp. VKM Ac-2527]
MNAMSEQQHRDIAVPRDADPVQLPQYTRRMVLAVWAAAAVPMGVLAWLVAPALAGHGASEKRFAVSLLVALTLGLLWQAVLVLFLVIRERRDPSWTSLRDRLWLRSPHTATRRGGRLWWWVVAYASALAAVDLAPFGLTGPANHNLGVFLGSEAGRQTFHHAWGLYALVAVELVLNTVLGEELLFRGLLLPRMNGAFGRADWVVNGLLFGIYHLHEPWVIPNAVATGFLCAGPTKRFRSALMGIAIHSVETVFFLVVLLTVVLG